MYVHYARLCPVHVTMLCDYVEMHMKLILFMYTYKIDIMLINKDTQCFRVEMMYLLRSIWLGIYLIS